MNFHQVEATTIRNLKQANISFLASNYFKLLLKCATSTQNIWFFNQCLQNQVTPKYINLKTHNTSKAAKEAVVLAQRKWICIDRKIQYSRRDSYNMYLKVIHTELLFKLNFIEFTVLDSYTREKVKTIIHKKYLKQYNKLQYLIQQKHITSHNKRDKEFFTDHQFFNRFINISNTPFSDTEQNLLTKGFKHNIQTNFNIKESETLGIDTEIALKDIPNNTLSKFQTAEIIKKEFISSNHFFNQDLRTIKTIQNKAKQNNVIFTRADKGNTVIAIDKIEYINKTLDFFNTGNYEILNKDPTNIFQKEIKYQIQQATGIIQDKDKFKLLNMNPKIPQLYSLIKLHKPDNPIRPVVSYMSAPAYKTSSFLIDLIKYHSKFEPKHSIKNSYELIEKIKNITIPDNSKLVSFDVKNLFPSVPPDETISLVENLLTKNKVNQIKKTDIINLLKTCLGQNYFSFNNRVYNCKEGLIMGSPLSPLLAEIFMDNIETMIFNNSCSNNCLYWYRYVDDIIVCFTGTDRQLTRFLQYINSLHRNISFTMEEEVEGKINFLDLTISKTMKKHEFAIYHKPSHTDTTIHNSSYHPIQHKLAAFYSFIHRLTNIPLSEYNFTKELNYIKQVAINNGYSVTLIENIVRKKLRNKAISEIYPCVKERKTLFKSLTYFGKPTEKLGKFLNQKNINIAYKTNNTIGKYLKNYKSQINRDNKSGVYQLACGSCPKTYIGQTGRTFIQRITEHEKSFIHKKSNSTYASHLLTDNHTFNRNFKILHTQQKGLKLNLLETMEINRLRNTGTLLNDQVDLNNSPLLNLFT